MFKMSQNALQQLIKVGSPLNCPDQEGNTPLWHAVETQNETFLRLLLEAGADKTIPNNLHQTPLMHAQKKELPLFLRLLGDSSKTTRATEQEPDWLKLILKYMQTGRDLEVAGETFHFVVSASKEKNHYAHKTSFYSRYMNNCYRPEDWIQERIAYLMWHKTQHIIAYLSTICIEMQYPLPSIESLKNALKTQHPTLHTRTTIEIEGYPLFDIILEGLYAGACFYTANRMGSTCWFAQDKTIWREEKDEYDQGKKTIFSVERFKKVFDDWKTTDGLSHTNYGVYGNTLYQSLKVLGYPTLRAYIAAKNKP